MITNDFRNTKKNNLCKSVLICGLLFNVLNDVAVFG